MKFLKFTFVIAALVGLTTIWGCGDDSTTDPTLSGTWVLISASNDNGALTVSGSPTVTLSVTDADGNGTFTMSGFTGDLITFNGSTSGTYTLSGTTSITFTSGTEENTATITSSPLTGGAGANWVVNFNANLAQHNDKNDTGYTYTFELQ